MFGGFARAAIERVGRFGDGFLGAALPPQFMAGLFRNVEAVWEKHDRSCRPRLVAQANVALGPESTVEQARRKIGEYYGFSGRADYVTDGLLATPESFRKAVDAFVGIGADEVVASLSGKPGCWVLPIDKQQVVL
ncbi:LLM class flavin-dependent oxidoreductase [Streptomyces sp. NPDC003362]